jgi:hypothetical protein
MDEKELFQEAKDILKRLNNKGTFNDVVLKKDNRIKASGSATIDGKKRIIKLNLKRLKTIDAVRITILHEIGHLMHPEAENYMELEYLAHSFAMDIIKVFYADTFEYAFGCLKDSIEDKNFKIDHPDHYSAFKKIYEEIRDEKAEKGKIKPDHLRD